MRFALLLPLWLALAVGEPSLVHPCPMHGAAAFAARPSEGGHQHASHTGAEHRQDAPHSSHTCSCIGSCTMATVAVLSDTAVIRVAIVEIDVVEAAAPMRPATAGAARLLPYSNGPPTQLS